MNRISPAFIELNLELKNKADAISVLVDKLDESGCLVNKKKYLNAVLERENLLSTYCGYHIAIPHAVSKAVKKVSFGFCRTTNLEWDKKDETVQFILILAIPDSKKEEDNYHIDLMSQIASLALEEKVREVWKNAKAKEEISRTFY
tara:strand:+ start:25470 stop:25907 length:438 start_codon:yes stop_codon:yes gene_type:complete